ncbi:MAG: 4-hydroxy-tetrahydrodipicolinate reductase [Pseudomonadota bacterium]
MSLIKVGISGANGRMGKAIESVISLKSDKFELVAKLTSSSTKSEVEKSCRACDVIIDFSKPGSLKHLMHFASKFSAKIVIGTTALEREHFRYIEEAAKNVAVVYAPNTSLGANLLEDLSIRAASILNGYDAEIVEAHHKYKKDSPSGTALAIGKSIAKARKIDFDANAVFDRCSRGLRQKDDITFSSIRGGGIFGEHEILFAGDNEVISIGHKALSRDAFAEGAVYAASWIASREPGLYSMRNVLGLDK